MSKRIPIGSIILITLTLLMAIPFSGLRAGQLDLIANYTPALNAWPAADGVIGSADDLINAALSPMNQSATNAQASLSYNAFDFGTGMTETGYLPTGMNAVTFLEGTVDVNVAAFTSTNMPVITAWNVSGTEPFPFHGAYTSQITTVNSGTYNSTTGEFTLNVDFTASLTGGSANAQNMNLTGKAYFRQAADYGSLTGDTYFDTILIPLAQSLSAGSVFYIHGNGTAPASTGGTGGSFPAMPIEAVIVATGSGTSPNGETTWGNIKQIFSN